MIPELDPVTGLLPPGIHVATWDELATRFGYNSQQRALLDGLRRALDVLRAAGCRRVYVDGSFVTAKDAPADFDACWEIDGVDFTYLAAHAPVLLHPFQMRRALGAEFGGDVFPARITADIAGTPFYKFFQRDTRTGRGKGIIALELEGGG